MNYGLAIRNLGLLYEQGRGVAKDEAEAARLYRRAMALGDTRAQVRLALLLQDGIGVPRDEQAALKLLQEALAENDSAAPAHLAKLKDRMARAASEARIRSRTGPAAITAEALEGGGLHAGAQALRRHLATNPNDAQAQFGLGALQFVSAVERLSQELYRYGLAPAHSLPLLD
jgi:TPR repeat protein